MTTRRIVVDHVLFVVGDLAASRRLYTAALAPVGYEELHVQENGVHYGVEGLDDFAIYQGAPVTTAAHVAFVNDLHGNNVEAVWHAPEPVKDAPIRDGVP
jgi:catechol 2,3-dioxygenase-like lactoylglutathione lyase family enzyme